MLCYLLSQFSEPEFPIPLGVFRNVEKPIYDHLMNDQVKVAEEIMGKANLSSLLSSGDTWMVE